VASDTSDPSEERTMQLAELLTIDMLFGPGVRLYVPISNTGKV